MLTICQQTLGSSSPAPASAPATAHVEHPLNARVPSITLLPVATPRLWRSSLLHGARNPSRRFSALTVQARNLQREQQQLKLSVLRFTLGIPGLDETYLPRWIGAAFGSLIVLNHFMSSSPSPAQLRSEALGLCLASFSTVLPYIGNFLEGETRVDRSTLPEGNQQIFIMSDNLLDSQKEDLAWTSYVILRNTNTMSVFIVVRGASCVRGYWNMPEDVSKVQILELLSNKFEETGFLDLKDTLYYPQRPDPEMLQILPRGTLSLLVQPISGVSTALDDDRTNIEGFVLLVSCSNYAYSDKDITWIRAISNKFQEAYHLRSLSEAAHCSGLNPGAPSRLRRTPHRITYSTSISHFGGEFPLCFGNYQDEHARPGRLHHLSWYRQHDASMSTNLSFTRVLSGHFVHKLYWKKKPF